MTDTELFIGGTTGAPVHLRLDRANRHGVIAGATGTGKTVTLQVLAQAFSEAGVPVFAADVKGDLSGLSLPGAPGEKMLARAATLGVELVPQAAPVVFWDLFGEAGHPIRATISDMGPVLLSRVFELNDVQEGVLTVAFHVADAEGLLLLDLDDLRAILTYVAENASEIGKTYGQVAPATVATIQRKLLVLESQGGAKMFGEPALRLEDLMRTDLSGRGYVNLLSAEKLVQSPRLYSTFLLWLLSELFEQLPEIGDPPKPRLVFFFDEAHLLFRDAPKSLLEKIELVVRLIRSKGVGVYFVTQNPADIPDAVLAQLGNRVQHALRAYTPAEQTGLRAAARSFRAEAGFDAERVIQALGVGEAVVSLLDEKGAPTPAVHALIRPPASRLGPATPAERAAVLAASPIRGAYDEALDRDSAHEVLARRGEETARAAEAARAEKAEAATARDRGPDRPRSNRQSAAEAFAKSVVRSVGSQIGREIMRGVLGSLRRR